MEEKDLHESGLWYGEEQTFCDECGKEFRITEVDE